MGTTGGTRARTHNSERSCHALNGIPFMGGRLAWPGRLACPTPEIVNTRGRQQGTAPLNYPSPQSDNEILSCRAGVCNEGGRRVAVHASTGEPGQVLTGAALIWTTDVCGVAGSRSEVVNLDREEGSTPAVRRFWRASWVRIPL